MAAIRYMLALLTASILFGQSSSQTFHLTTVTLPAEVNEIATILRTVGGITQLHAEASKSDITVRGSAAELTLAAWLVKQLDTSTPEPAQYSIPGGSDVVNTLFTSNTPTQFGLNELVSALRVVGNVQRIFTYSPLHGMVLRTSAANAPAAVWLAHQMDVAPDDQNLSQAHEFALAGTPPQSLKVIYLVHQPVQPAVLNEMLSTIRTIGDIKAIFTRSQPQGIAFRGSEADLALGEWLVKQADTETPQSAEFAIPGSGDVVNTVYFSNTSTNASLNELISAVRTVADVQRIFSDTPHHGVVVRTSAAKAGLATWMAHQLDVAPDDKNRWQPHEYSLGGDPAQVVKVIYLIHPMAQSGLNEMVTTIRTIADTHAIFTRSEPQGIVFRGSVSQAQLGDWLFQQLDVEPDAQIRAQKHEYDLPGAEDGITRVYYLNSANVNDIATAIRSETNVPKIFTCTPHRAVAVRGTPDTIAVADRVVKEHDGPAVQ